MPHSLKEFIRPLGAKNTSYTASKIIAAQHGGRMNVVISSCRRLLLFRHLPSITSATILHSNCVSVLPFSFIRAEMSTNETTATLAADTTTDTASNNNKNNAQQPKKNNQKKRKKHWFQQKQDKKRNRVEKQPEETRNRRGLDQDWESQSPHAGSFAHVDMQQQFNVKVPVIDNEEDDDGSNVKIPKRKVAMLIAYTGTNYGGFQINQGQHSLHAEIELALYKAQYLSPTNFGFPHKYGWSSSARTDKGVHACAQVVSAKLAIGDDMNAARETINGYLPSDIRVLDIVKTSRAFCAKTQRDRARYTYMIPSFLLYNRRELQTLFTSVLGPNPRDGRRARDPLTKDEITQLATELHKFRVTSQQLQDLQQALHQYEGTMSFHNFTNGKAADDAAAQRYIISFQTQDPILMEGTEWIPTQVVGQSFLLHQIRKMVSLAVDVARGSASMATMKRALSSASINLNLAPAQGLFLDMSFFEGYNRRKSNAQLHDLDWVTDETTPAVQRWKDFRENCIMKHIGEEEAAQGNFVRYLYMQEYVYDCKTQYKVDK